MPKYTVVYQRESHGEKVLGVGCTREEGLRLLAERMGSVLERCRDVEDDGEECYNGPAGRGVVDLGILIEEK